MNAKELKKKLKEKKYDEIISFINKLDNEAEIQEAIIWLKTNRVFIDTTGKNRYKRKIKKIINPSPIIQNYVYELNIVNLVFIQDKKVQNYLKRKIFPQDRLSALWRVLSEIYDEKVEEVKSDKIFALENIDAIINFHGNVEVLNTVFKSLLYDDTIRKGKAFKYKIFKFFTDKTDIRHCRKYIGYSIWADTWDQKYHDWLQDRVSLHKEGSLIKIRYVNKETLDWFLKSCSKRTIYDDINEVQIASMAERYPLTFTDGEKDYEYALACGLVKDTFHTDNLNETASEIPLNYWIWAYEILVQYSRKWLAEIAKEEIGFIRTLYYKQYFWREKDYWIKTFEEGNIPSKEAEKLFSLMVYDKNSEDLYDSPFVAVKDKYVIPYFLLKDASVGLILRSRLRKADVNMAKKGKLFEIRIIKMLESKGIPVIQLHRRDKFNGSSKKEDYECDVAFILGNTLFLCECKDNGERAVSERIHEFYKEDVKQVNRYCDYFETHKDYVIEVFNQKGYKVSKINKAIRLLIYNTYFHKPIDCDGVKIIDFERIAAPIRRGNLDLEICWRYGGPIRCLQGNFTAQKLLEYIKSNYIVCDYDKITKNFNQSLMLGKYKLEVETEIHSQIERTEILKLISPAARWAEELGIRIKKRDILRNLFSR